MEERDTIEPTLSRATKAGLIVWGVWTGCTLLALMWNSAQYSACMQDDWMCFDLTVPILAVWAFVSMVGWGMFGIVRSVRRHLRSRA